MSDQHVVAVPRTLQIVIHHWFWLWRVTKSLSHIEKLVVCFIFSGSGALKTPQDIYTSIGSTVNLTCNLNVDRMYVTWLGPPNQTSYAIGNKVHTAKNFTVRILGNEQERQHILQIVKMHETDEGLYKCIAIEGNKSFQLFIQSTYTFTCIHLFLTVFENAQRVHYLGILIYWW